MENIVRASHLNVTKNLVTSMGPQLLLQTALYARIGIRPMHVDLSSPGSNLCRCYPSIVVE